LIIDIAKNTALVSVIVPNYNHARYLNQRIDSILNQTYQDFEIIILDDCSTDNSKEIIEQYRANKKVTKIVYNSTNSGSPFMQWHIGIELAVGKYIWLAESDDWSEPYFLETIIKGIEANKNAVLGYAQSYCINGTNTIQFQSTHPVLEEYIEGKRFIADYMLQKNPIFNAGMAVWKKDVYDKIPKDFMEYKVIGDYYFWIKLCFHGDVFISGRLLNFFRTHDKSLSGNSFKNGQLFIEQLSLLKILLNDRVIDDKTYIQAVQKNYMLFQSYRKNMPKENVSRLKKMYPAATPMTDIKLKFYKKQLKDAIKKIARGTKPGASFF